MNRIGFIGAGNMGTAMIRGLAQANLVKREEIIVGGLVGASIIGICA
ncbi:NAD(P)-binding domain-containing protein, partial [Listeria monocytogenes]